MLESLVVMFIVYSMVAVIKTVLVCMHVPTAAAVIAGHMVEVGASASLSKSTIKCTFLLFLVTPIVTIFMIPYLLYKERTNFFTPYTEQQIVVDTLKGLE